MSRSRCFNLLSMAVLSGARLNGEAAETLKLFTLRAQPKPPCSQATVTFNLKTFLFTL